MSHRNYIEEAKVVTDRFYSALSDIANDRLSKAVFEMEGKLKGPLEVIFDMGAESITYCGNNVQFSIETIYRKWSLTWDMISMSNLSELKPLGEAIHDLHHILDDGCQLVMFEHGPNDIAVGTEMST